MARSTDNPEVAGGRRPSGTRTLDRGLDLLELVARQPMAIRELVDRSNLSPSAAKRLVNGLIGRGFLTLGAEGQLRTGPTLLRLGEHARRNAEGLLATARPHLERLSARTGLSAFLGHRQGDYSVHLHRTPGAQRVLVATPVGTRRRLAETSLGKALLLDDDPASFRRLFGDANVTCGWDEWESDMRQSVAGQVVLHQGPPPDSIRAIAAPVRDASGRIVAAVSVATVAQYLDRDQMPELGSLVRDAARSISSDLGWQT